jgi:hypothetical protein
MKHINRLVGLSFVGALLLAACANGNKNSTSFGGSGGSGTTGIGGSGTTAANTVAATTADATTGANTVATTGATTSTGSGACPAMCGGDGDCGTCPSVPTGESNCCDLQTMTCYVNATSTCPAGNPASGTSTGAGYGG